MSPRSCRPMVSGENGTAVDAVPRLTYPAAIRAFRRNSRGLFFVVVDTLFLLLSGYNGDGRGGTHSAGAIALIRRAARMALSVSWRCHAPCDGAHRKPSPLSSDRRSASGRSSKMIWRRLTLWFTTTFPPSNSQPSSGFSFFFSSSAIRWRIRRMFALLFWS